MSKVTFVMESDLTPAQLKALVDFESGDLYAFQLGKLFRSHAMGVSRGSLRTKLGATDGFAVCRTINGAANDALVVTLGGVALTAKGLPATAGEFLAVTTSGGTQPERSLNQATAIANCINAHPVLGRVFEATVAAETGNNVDVTITSIVPGALGTCFALAETTDTGNIFAITAAFSASGATEGDEFVRDFR